MTINLNKKTVIITIVCIIVVLSGIFAYKMYQKNTYNKAVVELKDDLSIRFMASSYICADISEQWSNAINDDECEDEYGETEYCSDFNIAIRYCYKKWTNRGAYNILDSLSNKDMELMKTLNNNKGGDSKEIHSSVEEIYGLVSKMYDQAKSPNGSLMTFNQTTNQLFADTKAKLESLDLKLDGTKKESDIQASAMSVLFGIFPEKSDDKK